MQGASRHFRERREQADQTLRRTLFAAAYGRDPVAARAALESLRRLYHLRLPLQEARLGITAAELVGAGLVPAQQGDHEGRPYEEGQS